MLVGVTFFGGAYMSQAQTSYERCLKGLIPYSSPGTPEECEFAKRSVTEGDGSTDPAAGTQDADGSTNPTPGNQNGDGDTDPTPGTNKDADSAKDGVYGTGAKKITLNDPLKNSGIVSIEGLVKTLLNVLIVIAAPIVVIFIILSGFKYVTAQGDPGKLEEAKRALVYAIIGGVIIVGATAIFEIIVNTINAFKG